MSGFNEVSPGDRVFPLSSEAYNAFVRVARAFLNGTIATGGEGGGLDTSGLVLVKNNSGAERDRFDVLGLGEPMILPSANRSGFLKRIAFNGETPTDQHSNKFAILLGPIQPGKTGWAIAESIVPCLINVTDESATSADIAPGEYRLQTGSSGAQILFREEPGDRETPGVAWAILRLGGGGGGGSGLSFVRVSGPYDDDTLPRLADVFIANPMIWGKSASGTLTTRTSDTAGVVTTTGTNAVTVGDLVDVSWAGGRRSNMRATDADLTTATLAGGTGDVLPDEDTAVTITIQGYFVLEGDPLAGSLTTRTSDTAGIVTLSGPNTVVSGDRVTVIWLDGERRNMRATAVAGSTVTLSGGSGDVLPASDTEVVIRVQHFVLVQSRTGAAVFDGARCDVRFAHTKTPENRTEAITLYDVVDGEPRGFLAKVWPTEENADTYHFEQVSPGDGLPKLTDELLALGPAHDYAAAAFDPDMEAHTDYPGLPGSEALPNGISIDNAGTGRIRISSTTLSLYLDGADPQYVDLVGKTIATLVTAINGLSGDWDAVAIGEDTVSAENLEEKEADEFPAELFEDNRITGDVRWDARRKRFFVQLSREAPSDPPCSGAATAPEE